MSRDKNAVKPFGVNPIAATPCERGVCPTLLDGLASTHSHSTHPVGMDSMEVPIILWEQFTLLSFP